MGFRLNLKGVSVSLVPSHFLANSPSSSNLPSLDRGRDTYFNSAKLSFMSVIFDEDVLLVKDPLREYPSTAALQT